MDRWTFCTASWNPEGLTSWDRTDSAGFGGASNVRFLFLARIFLLGFVDLVLFDVGFRPPVAAHVQKPRT